MESIFNLMRGEIPAKVTITGGEPLEQSHITLGELIGTLRAHGSRVTVETAGTVNVLEFMDAGLVDTTDENVSFVVDYKLSSSKFVGKMDIEWLFRKLRPWDTVKFVVGSKEDFDEAREAVKRIYGSDLENEYNKPFSGRCYFSPVHGSELSPSQLFQLMKDDREVCIKHGVGLNIQLHKYIFPEDFREEESLGTDYTKRTLGREEFLRRARETNQGE